MEGHGLVQRPFTLVETEILLSNVAVRIRDLTKKFGDRVAVDIHHLDLAKGGCCGLIGPNGAGKTTLVKLIAGLLEPTTVGELAVLGCPSARLRRQERREIGLVTDASQLYGTLTVLENLTYMARLYGVPKRERDGVIAQALEVCSMTQRRHDRVNTLSTGLKQRANIARALSAQPQLLLLDEPTSGLDPSASQRVYDALVGLQATGISMIICTHVMAEVDDLCDRVLFMNGSRIVSDATPERMRAIAGERVYTIILQEGGDLEDLRRRLAEQGLHRTAVRRSDGQLLISVYGCEDPSVMERLGVDYRKAGATLSDAFVLLEEAS